MAEEPFDLKSLGITADSPAESAAAGKSDAKPADDGEEPEAFVRSAEAKAIDDHVKASIRKNIENHEIACFVVDLVSPGRALERLGGVGLEHLTPTQHMLVACTAIAGTVFVTNPALAKKLKNSITRGDKAATKDALPEGKPAAKPKQEAKPETKAPTPPPGLRDLTGNPL